MDSPYEFQITEDGMIALVQTCHNLSLAVTDLSRRCEEMQEALVVFDARLALIEKAVRQPVSAWT